MAFLKPKSSYTPGLTPTGGYSWFLQIAVIFTNCNFLDQDSDNFDIQSLLSVNFTVSTLFDSILLTSVYAILSFLNRQR